MGEAKCVVSIELVVLELLLEALGQSCAGGGVVLCCSTNSWLSCLRPSAPTVTWLHCYVMRGGGVMG